MRNFSIRELENLCGIQAPTLRVWEQRYALVTPKRNGRMRRYSLDEMEKLLLVSWLSKCGHKISSLSKLSVPELLQNFDALKGDEERKGRAICRLILSMYRLDIEAHEAVLNDSFLSWSSHVVITEIIYPFLRKVNLLFQGRRTTEEHLVVTSIRKKMLWCIERIETTDNANKTAVLFLSGERQLDMLLLYACFRLRNSGWNVLNLGVDVSLDNLSEILKHKHPHILFTYLPRRSTSYLNNLVETITQNKNGTSLVLADVHNEQPLVNDAQRVTVMSADDAIDYLLAKTK